MVICLHSLKIKCYLWKERALKHPLSSKPPSNINFGYRGQADPQGQVLRVGVISSINQITKNLKFCDRNYVNEWR